MSLAATAFELGQAILAPGAGRALAAMLKSWRARHRLGEAILDVGAGPRSWLSLIGAQPVVLDLAPWAVASHVADGGVGAVGDAARLPFADGSFDSIWSFGLLHHLPDAAARAAVGEMQRVCRRGGAVAVFDGVLPRRGSFGPARLIRRWDRGRWMRSEDALKALLGAATAWDCEPIRYAATGLDGALATWRRL